MPLEISKQQFLDKFVKNLIYYGFRADKNGSVYVKNIGSASCLVLFYDATDILSADFYDHLSKICDNISESEWSTNTCLEFFVFTDLTKITDNDIASQGNVLKSRGVVGDITFVDAENKIVKKAGNPKYVTKEVSKALNDAILQRTEKIAEIQDFGTKNYWLLYVISAFMALVFLGGRLLEYAGYGDIFIYYGILSNELVSEGEWWRLFTPIFLHADVGHLIGNLISLIYFGRVILRRYRKREFTAIFVLSGIAGNVASYFLCPLLSLGASGAVMGLGGVIIFKILFAKDKQNFRNGVNYLYLGFLVLYNLVYGFLPFVQNVNNFAHLGGFVTGFLLAAYYEKKLRRDVTA